MVTALLVSRASRLSIHRLSNTYPGEARWCRHDTETLIRESSVVRAIGADWYSEGSRRIGKHSERVRFVGNSPFTHGWVRRSIVPSVPTTLGLHVDRDKLLSRIDAVCERFEDQLQQPAMPRIETFLEGWEFDERQELFRHLLELEFDYRQRAGQCIVLEEYLRRFPEFTLLIQVLLETSDGDHRSADTSASRPDPKTPDQRAAALPASISDYQIVREIGRGGMGVVYEARQQSLRRRVALKVLLPHVSHNVPARDRFRQEAQLAAKLHHTNIVPVFEVGEDGDTCFFAMQFIEGQSLDVVRRTTYQSWMAHRDQGSGIVAAGDLSDDGSHARKSVNMLAGGWPATRRARQDYFRQVAGLGAEVADALEFAHRHGVVHRDVKPSNLLLDQEGGIWVTDFGLATNEESNLTRTGDLLGTLRYMSPERFQGNCDHRGDVYGLGATLYELLTLQPVFHATDHIQLMDVISRHEPAPPRTLQTELPRDLETIVLKAMQKDPQHRYQSAEELARDLRSFTKDEPISARPLWPVQRLLRWSRRNPTIAGLTALVATMLFMTTIIAVGAAIERGRLSQQAQRYQHRAEDRLVDLHTANGQRLLDQRRFARALPWLAQAVQLDDAHAASRGVDVDPVHRRRLAMGLRGCPKFRQLWSNPQGINGTDVSADGTRMVAACGDGTARIWNTETGEPVGAPLQHADAVALAKFSPDGRFVTTAVQTGTIFVWDTNAHPTTHVELQHSSTVADLAFSPDNMQFAAGGEDGIVRIWELGSSISVLATLRHDAAVNSLWFHANGTELLSASADHSARVWNIHSGEEILRLTHGLGVQFARYSSNGDLMVTASHDRTASVWRRDGQRVGAPLRHDGVVHYAEFSPDDKLIASACDDGTARIWDLASGQPLTLPHERDVTRASFSPDGRHLVTSSDDFHVRLWLVDDGRLAMPPLRHGGEIIDAHFLDDSRRILTSSYGRVAYLWDLALTQPPHAPLKHASEVTHAEFSPDNRFVLTASLDRSVRLWNARDGSPHLRPLDHDHPVNAATFSPDGRVIASGSGDSDQGELRLWQSVDGMPIRSVQLDEPAEQVVFNPSGTQLGLVAGPRVLVFDGLARTQRFELEHGERVSRVDFSSCGKHIATASYDHTARLWNAETGEPRFVPLEHDCRVDHATFSHDGRWLMSTCSGEGQTESTVHLWDTATGKRVRTFSEHKAWYSLYGAFDANDRQIVSAGSVTAYLWDPLTGRSTTSPLRHQGMVEHVQFSPDGRFVATASWDNFARLWHADTGLSVGAPIQHGNWVTRVAFNADGTRLLSVSRDGTARITDLSSSTDSAEELIAAGELLAGERVQPNGGSAPLDHTQILTRWRALSSQRQMFVPSRTQVLNWHWEAAQHAISKNSWEAAGSHLEHVMRLDPSSKRAQNAMARIRAQLNP